jgi:hypothetical protein
MFHEKPTQRRGRLGGGMLKNQRKDTYYQSRTNTSHRGETPMGILLRTKTHSGLETHRRRTLRTLQTRTQHPHRQTPPSPRPAQTRHTHPTSRPHRGRLANVHSQVAHWVSHRRAGRTHPSHARGQPNPRAPPADPRPTGTAHPARRYAGLSHAPRGSRVVSRDTGRGAVGASDATAGSIGWGFKRKIPRPMAVRADAALQAQGKQGGLARR